MAHLPWACSCLGYGHAGCLQLSHVLTADPSADGRRSAANCHWRGAYRLAAPGVITCYILCSNIVVVRLHCSGLLLLLLLLFLRIAVR